MIRPSPELVAVVRRWNDAVRSKDSATLSNMLSSSDHLRYQGSDDQEIWSGKVFREGFPDHVREIPEYDWVEHSLEAFENGSVGWAHCTATLTFSSNARSSIHRFTFVLCLEDGAWRMVQMHVSNPTSNVEKIGIEHRALDALITAARDGFRQDQREGMASVMFTDIARSSELAELMGDRAWADRVSQHFDLVGAAIEAEDGKLVKSLGDGTMSTFRSAAAAIRAAISIQRDNAEAKGEPSLQLRLGIHTGDVIQTKNDFFGSVVNKAARIAASAAPGEVRLSDAARIMVGSKGDFAFSDPIRQSLRGLDGDHLLYRLEWRP